MVSYDTPQKGNIMFTKIKTLLAEAAEEFGNFVDEMDLWND